MAERFQDWIVWYGRSTGRWWALPPTWCWYARGLVEAGSPEELADRIRQVERARPRFDRGRGRPSRRVRPGGRPARGAGLEADGRCSA
ncbi:hypothetical protein AB0K60_20235 [Thermopolyspora sp. NPDC052614]|uniref:hypothetical protein n=1 Tax=Thermopolyspora sp. NPDC052614 TaxID=3155682 RepID=UPI00342CE156